MLLYKIAFMLGSKVHTPSCYRELKLVSSLYSVFKNVDSFSISKSDKVFVYNRFQRINKRFVNHLIEEFQIVLAIG